MKNKSFGHLKTSLFSIKTSKNVGFGGSWYLFPLRWSLLVIVIFTLSSHQALSAFTSAMASRADAKVETW